MTTPLFPSPLSRFLQGVVYLAPYIYGAGTSAFEHFSSEDDPSDFKWCHVACIGTRASPSGTTEDVAQISFDFANFTGGELDGSWTQQDHTDLYNILLPFLTSVAGLQSNTFVWKEIRQYVAQFKEGLQEIAPMGDPAKVNLITIAGTSTATTVLPYQVAMSCTEKTAVRKSWGRFYLPSPAFNAMDAFGRFTQSYTGGLLAMVGDMHTATTADGFLPVVVSSRHRALYTITALQVDDVPDVIRSRRARTTNRRDVLTTV